MQDLSTVRENKMKVQKQNMSISCAMLLNANIFVVWGLAMALTQQDAGHPFLLFCFGFFLFPFFTFLKRKVKHHVEGMRGTFIKQRHLSFCTKGIPSQRTEEEAKRKRGHRKLW